MTQKSRAAQEVIDLMAFQAGDRGRPAALLVALAAALAETSPVRQDTAEGGERPF